MATYKSQYTGTQIDTAVGRAAPDGEIDRKINSKMSIPETNSNYITVPTVNKSGAQDKLYIDTSSNTGLGTAGNLLLVEKVPLYTSTSNVEYIKFRQITEADYNTSVHDDNTIYIVVG